MGVMANVFYIDQGFTKDQIAGVSKVFGLIMTHASTVIYKKSPRAALRPLLLEPA